MPEPAITVNSLTKHFGSIVAVDGIDFSIPMGSATALLGGNGAGKTTTISMLLGLLLPTKGTISVLGENILQHRYRVLPSMNFSSPYVDLPGRLTTAENLRVYAQLYGLLNVRARLRELAAAFSLGDFMDRKVASLSAGQKTRIALAKALINTPDLLLLDEPTASLDPDTADWVRGYLKEYQAETGATIVLASHNMAEVERMCDDVIMMRAGRIVDRGAPTALIDLYGRANLEEVFLDIARANHYAGAWQKATQ
jgi:ABC-2 type transport system ATP-binding protein